VTTRDTTFELAGGIGNQLFQFSAGLSLAIETEKPLQFDVSRLGRGTSKRRENVLDMVTLSGSSSIEYLVSTSRRPRILDTIVYRSKFANHVEKKFMNVYRSPSVGYDEGIYHLEDNVLIRGYFQSYRYYENLQKWGIYFSFDESLFSKTYWNLVAEIDFEADLAIHIRRGDYLQHWETIGLLDDSFFEQGINTLNPKGRVFIFSDDAQPMLNGFEKYKTILTTDLMVGHPVESLALMSKFKNIVISNSTFSWWAASLGRVDKNIVCPKPWYRSMKSPVDLIPNDWIKIESSWVATHD
jgi:hypothetical protein